MAESYPCRFKNKFKAFEAYFKEGLVLCIDRLIFKKSLLLWCTAVCRYKKTALGKNVVIKSISILSSFYTEAITAVGKKKENRKSEYLLLYWSQHGVLTFLRPSAIIPSHEKIFSYFYSMSFTKRLLHISSICNLPHSTMFVIYFFVIHQKTLKYIQLIFKTLSEQ